MAGKKIGRNDPCPCGSGKKYKQCCIGKDIDWEARKRPASARLLGSPRPRTPNLPAVPLHWFELAERKLKELAAAHPEPADWKTLVERLSPQTSRDERMRTFQAIRAAGVLPPDATHFLLDHGIQTLHFDEIDFPEDAPEDYDPFEEATPLLLRRYGADDLAELYESNRLEYDRARERGRQFFHGPPDEELAARLRSHGIID